MAMYRAKEQGRNRYHWYADGMTARAQERLELEEELHRALDGDQLRVHYQPIFDLEMGEIVGVEALVRWHHPRRGLLTPDRFLPLAEETGLIVAVDAWVLGAACAQIRRWREDGLPSLRLAVNISGRTFQQPWLAETVMRALDEHALEPEELELEVSENVAGHEAAETLAVLDRLRALGVRVAIDDFGTGYSVLSRLRGFPVNTLKVDKSFVQDITSDADEGPIVSGLIAMAHRLDVEVTAEGVETPEQLLFLRRHGCDNVQGYLLGRPVEPRRIPELVERGEHLSASGSRSS
jgi:EAL domain-containing protein (putative c-di-GMP-specific phosphodiesterase class I)